MVGDAKGTLSDTNANFCVLEDHFKILGIIVLTEKPIIQDDLILVQLKLDSNFPRQIFVDKMSLSYEMNTKNSSTDLDIMPLTSANAILNSRLDVMLHLDYKQDNTLACASVACDTTKSKQPVRRTSSTRRKLSPTVRADFTNYVVVESVAIQPGINLLELTAKAYRVGTWSFKQVNKRLYCIQFKIK